MICSRSGFMLFYFLLFWIVVGICYLAIYISSSLALYKVAIVENRSDIAWMAFVPILNICLLLILSGKSPYLIFAFLLNLIPIIGGPLVIIFSIYICILLYRMFKAYNVEPLWFIVGCFFPPVIIVAYYKLFKNATYIQNTRGNNTY